MEVGLPGVIEDWSPKWPTRGLSANQIERALISMVARSNEPLQSEAGYIDARPQTRSTNLLATHGRTIHWVISVAAPSSAFKAIRT